MRTEDAKFGLQLVLGFFSRVDSRASVVLGINTGMLALLAGKLPHPSEFQWKMSVAAIATLFLARSYWFLFKTAFPDLKGPTASLIYFGEIANRIENAFVEEFSEQTEEEYYKDMLGQVWRNSQILSKKFAALRLAFIWMLLAVVPWVISIAIFVSHTGPSQQVHPQKQVSKQ